jgi:acetyl esterase/lipase
MEDSMLILRHALAALALATGLLGQATVPALGTSCQFVLGFATLHAMIPTIVGDCLVDEHHNPVNGDGLQETTGGLLVWRKADNWTAFTDGYRTWINGPFGLQERLNTQRFPWEGGAPAAAGGRAASDVTYCTAYNDPNNTALLMDVYTPDGTLNPPPSTRPSVVAVHGGGWHSGDKSGITGSAAGSALLNDLLASNYVVFAIDYRLAPAYVHPAQIEDVKCAIRSVKANASKWGIDPGRVAIWGGSAGGHLAALAATAGPGAGWDVGQYSDQSSSVAAAVDWFGPNDLWTEYQEALAKQATDPAVQAALPWIPATFGTSRSALLAASPVSYVNAGDPPVIIEQGTDDLLVFPDQAQEFANALQAAGVPTQLVWVQNAGHGFVAAAGRPIGPSTDQIATNAVQFLLAHNP